MFFYYFEPVFLSTADYYPFGFEMPGRKYNFGGYRYGFNGKENDTDGEFSSLTHYDYGFRIYNPALGRFLSVDPLTRSYPMLTPYQFASNSPIANIDLDGLERYYAADGEYLGKYGKSNEIRVITSAKIVNDTKTFLSNPHNNDLRYLDLNLPALSQSFHEVDDGIQSNIATTVYGGIKNRKVSLYNNRVSVDGNNIPTELNDGNWEIGADANATYHKKYGGVLNLINTRLYSDYYNMVNGMIHEESHILEIMEEGHSSAADDFSHFKVYMKQFKHSSFQKTTALYQNYIRGKAVTYINDMAEWVYKFKAEYGEKSDYHIFYNKEYEKGKKDYEDFFNLKLEDTGFYKGNPPLYRDPEINKKE